MNFHAAKVRDPKCPCCRPGSRKAAKTLIARSARRAARRAILVELETAQ
jgi:hypothetical protein